MSAGLQGRVRDLTGEPVPGALVVLVPRRGTPPVPELAVLTEDDGTFAWPAPLPPGDYRVEVRTATGTATADVALAPGRSADVDLRG